MFEIPPIPDTLTPSERRQINAMEKLIERSGWFLTACPPGLNVHSLLEVIWFKMTTKAEVSLIFDRNVLAYVLGLLDQRKTASSETDYRAAAVMAFCLHAMIDFDANYAIAEVVSGISPDRGLQEVTQFLALQNLPVRCYQDILDGHRIFLDPVEVAKETPTSPPQDIHIDLEPRIEPYYVAALKLATLWIKAKNDKERYPAYIEFLRWSYEDYLILGPAVLYGSLAFCPNRRRSMFKDLNSGDPDLALKGVKNAAWDIALLGYYAQASQLGYRERTLTILCSNDYALRTCATGMLQPMMNESQRLRFINRRLVQQWGEEKGTQLYREYARMNLGCFTDTQRAVKKAPPDKAFWKASLQGMVEDFRRTATQSRN